MIIPVTPNSLDETNLLLRALWAELRQDYGKLAWQFSPARHGDKNAIYFGWADIGVHPTIRIGVVYKRRGIASGVVFENVAAADESRIRKCVANATVSSKAPTPYSFTVPVQMSLDVHMSDLAGQHVLLQSQEEGAFQLGLRVQAFDQHDAKSELNKRVRLILDALAFMTNCQFRATTSMQLDFLSKLAMRFRAGLRIAKRPAKEGVWRFMKQSLNSPKDILRRPSKLPDNDWLDGYPVVDGIVALNAQSMNFLDALTANELDDPAAMLADAAHHFHSGLVAEELRFDSTTVGASAEQAVVFYLSALEVASLIGAPEPKSCSTCGQPQHRIAARVTEFVDRMIGGTAPDLVKMLYSSRSAYLHRGLLLSSRSYAGVTLPQLDPSSTTGVLAPVPVAPILNLREYTSYCLRRVAIEHVP